MMAIQIRAPHLLVVEGEDEKRLFGALIKYMGIQDIQVMGIGGKTRLRENLKALLASPGFSEVISLGIVRDANDDPQAAFQSVCEALRAVNLPVPPRPFVLTDPRPRTAVMILPDGEGPGSLEDLCLHAVADDLAMPCIEQYAECLNRQGLPLPRHASKAKVQVFLASRREPGKRLGEAAEAGYWPWDREAFERVEQFLGMFG